MNRFVDIDCSFNKLPPVYGFRSTKLVSLQEALQPIEPHIDKLAYYVKIAEKHCNYPNKDGLSKDQSASIYIYTMEWGETTLYRVLNEALRVENRQALKIWFPYLKLFDTALDLLRTVKEVVWRGVPLDIGKNFTKNQIFTWWSISSCSSSVNVIETFLQNKSNSTLFLIEVINGKKVSGYTEYEAEDEIILRSGTEFRVKSNPLKRADGSHTVHLIEINDDEDDDDDNSKQSLATAMKSLDVKPKPKSVLSSSIVSVDNYEHELLEAFSFIWLANSFEGGQNIEKKFSSIFNNMKKFEEVKKCLIHIQQSAKEERLILIVNGALGKQIVPSIHKLEQVVSIYVYCLDKKVHLEWSSNFTKVKDVVTDLNELIYQFKEHFRMKKEMIKEPLQIKMFSDEGELANQLNGKFINFQVLLDCLLRLKSTEADVKELINLYANEYEGNANELKYLKDFHENYLSDKAVWWYTRESFFYRTMNIALRSENIHVMFLLRSYILDIQQQLKEHQCQQKLTVYRSQIMSENEFEHFKQSEGQLISVNAFFSASKDHKLALHRLGIDTHTVVNWKRILFEIDADPKMVKKKPFADVSHLSYFPDECEIIFMIGSIFYVNEISRDQNQLYTVKITLYDENEHDFKHILKDMKKRIGKGETNLRTLANYLWEIGELELAEKYLMRFKNDLSSKDPLLADVYEELAKLTSQMKTSEKSLQWHGKLIEYKEQNPIISSIRSSVNLVKIATNDIEYYEKIGCGGFGAVYRAKWLTNDIIVSIKKLHPTHFDVDAEKTFLNELSLLNRIRHPHIITFYGACVEDSNYALVMEYISLGSLYQLLHKEKVELSWANRFCIALDAARGINHLHQYQPQILHCDIKSLNILLENRGTQYQAKICDFGMAKTRDETTRQTKGIFLVASTIAWSAPEILRMESYTIKSDVFSLGMVYWELAGYQIPYDGHESGNIRAFVLAGERLCIPSTTPQDFRSIIEQCWAPKPEDRPTCADLLKTFNKYDKNQISSTNKSLATAIPLDNLKIEVLGNVCLVWLDSNLQESEIVEQKLCSIINHFEKFQDNHRCQQFIQQCSASKRLILVTTGCLGRDILRQIHDNPQLISVFIYCLEKKVHQQWSSRYSKVKGVITSLDELYSKITEYHRIVMKIVEPLAINIYSIKDKPDSESNQKFVFFQSLLDCILKLKSTSEDKNELIQLLNLQYNENLNEQYDINGLQTRYQSCKALQWYTQDILLHKTLNSALRTENIHWIFLQRSFILDIQQQLQKYQPRQSLKVYRAQILSKDEFSHLKNSINQFMCINSFLSTTTTRSKAQSCFDFSKSEKNTEKILFEIEANPNVAMVKPFANISQFSHCSDENEVLFMAGSIFRVKNILFDHKNQLSTISMTLTSLNDNALKQVLTFIRQPTGQTDIRVLTKLLFDRGNFELAESYLDRKLKQLPSNDPLIVELYEDLSRLAAQSDDMNKCMMWQQKASEFRKQMKRSVR